MTHTSNANALVVNVAAGAPGGCCDDGDTHSWGQAHVANVHVDWDAPLAPHTVVTQLLRGVIHQARIRCPSEVLQGAQTELRRSSERASNRHEAKLWKG